eukprot:9695215-Karenia_brevis.AAC.1
MHNYAIVRDALQAVHKQMDADARESRADPLWVVTIVGGDMNIKAKDDEEVRLEGPASHQGPPLVRSRT